MVRVLYLHGREGFSVGLDGPALRVRRPFRAEQIFPLSRLARIVTVGQVEWRPEATRACFQNRIPIAVLDSLGRFVRIRSSVPDRLFGWARHIAELLAVPKFAGRYEEWRRFAEASEKSYGFGRLLKDAGSSRRRFCWQDLCVKQGRRWGSRTTPAYRYLAGLTAARVASFLAAKGIPRETPAWNVEEFRLFRDIVGLERWRLFVLFEDWATATGRIPNRQELTAAFESDAGPRDSRIETCWQQILDALMGRSDQASGSAETDTNTGRGTGRDRVESVTERMGRGDTRADFQTLAPLVARDDLRAWLSVLQARLQGDGSECESRRIA